MSKNNTIGMGRDKRTDDQRANDVAQKATPGSSGGTFVTTGPTTGISDTRAKDVADKGAVFEDGTVKE